MTKKRILWVTSSFPVNESDDSVVPWMVELVTRLSKDYEIDIFTADFKGSGANIVKGMYVHRFRYWFKQGETLTNLNGLNNQLGKPWNWPKIASWYINGWLQLRKLLSWQVYDYVVVNWAIPHLFWVPKSKSYKIITKEYGSTAYKLSKGLFKQYIEDKSDILIAISNYVKQMYGDKAIYIPELQKVDILPQFDKPVHPKTRILFVGRLVERKGISYLLSALQLLQNVELYIVGEGELKEKLKRLAEDIIEYNPTNNVYFMGQVSEGTLKELYLNTNMVVLPSIVDSKGNTEGQGVVLLEAIHAGTPVIASNIGGIPDMIKDGETGILVPEKDYKSLAKSIQFYIASPSIAKLYAERAYQDIVTRFSWDSVIGQWHKMLD